VPSGAPVSVLAGKLMTVGNNVTITSNGSTYRSVRQRVERRRRHVGDRERRGGAVDRGGTLGISGPGSTVTVNAGGTLRQTGNRG
jgi:hypothetical protein